MCGLSVLLFVHRVAIPELLQLAITLFRSDSIHSLSLFLQSTFDYKQSLERKDVVIRNGVDIALDKHRALYENMLSILDECTATTKQQLLEWIADREYDDTFDLWGYEFLPRSICNELNLMDSWICVCGSNRYGKTDWNRYDYL